MIPRRVLPQAVTIRPYEGEGASGAIYGPAVTVRARVDQTRKLVRDPNGAEVVAEATVTLDPGVVCPPGSKIQLPGDTGERLTINYSPVVGATARVHHVEVTTE